MYTEELRHMNFGPVVLWQWIYYPVTDRQTESVAYEPTVEHAQVGSINATIFFHRPKIGTTVGPPS